MTSNALHPAWRALLRTLLPVSVAVALAAMVWPTAAGAAGLPGIDAREAAIVDRINAVRRQHGLAALELGQRISRAADRHSRRMARARTLTHRVQGEGALAGRLRWAVGNARVGEVIFWGRGGVRSAEVVRAWMDSPGHRALLLSRDFAIAGIGLREGGGGIYATVDLASS